MITISLCMIVKDEEDVLARCLQSVKGLADEIIIVDTGSSDRTVEIARAYTEKIYFYPWQDDFSAARNFSFSKAEMEYCMWLDADDVIKEKDREELLKLKEELDSSVDVVMLPYQTGFDSAGRLPSAILENGSCDVVPRLFGRAGSMRPYPAGEK